jgi:hypothetical protein
MAAIVFKNGKSYATGRGRAAHVVPELTATQAIWRMKGGG